MARDDHPSEDPDPLRWAWLALGVGLFAVLASGAVGVYKVWLAATTRPADDVWVEVIR